MAGVTSTGFESKTTDEIILELAERAKDPAYFGVQFPTTPDSPYGILSGVIGSSIKEGWDLTASVASQANKDEAEGKYLDDIAAYRGLVRLGKTSSVGNILFNSNVNGVVVPATTPIKFKENNEVVLVSNQVVVQLTSCNSSVLQIPAVIVVGNTYSVIVNNIVKSVVAVISDTTQTIRDNLLVEINTGVNTYAANANGTDSILITNTGVLNALRIDTLINVTFTTLNAYIPCEAATQGAIEFFANSVVTLLSAISGITSVSVTEDWSTGREVETDAELRDRIDNLGENTGTATKPSIQASVSNVSGVSSVAIVENITFNTVDSRPPKSYEVYVEGGIDGDIATVVWETKPAGIETWGDIQSAVIDNNGDTQIVRYSRYSNRYAWVRVTFEIYSEEDLIPQDITTAIRNSVVDTGNDMNQGEDLEPSKFYGGIYSSTSGIYVKLVETDITDLPSDIPVYSSTRKSVADTERLLFDFDRTGTLQV